MVLILTNQTKQNKKQLAKKKRKEECPRWDSDLWMFKVQDALLPFKFLYTVHSSLVPLRIYNYLILLIHIYFRIKILSDFNSNASVWHLRK